MQLTLKERENLDLFCLKCGELLGDKSIAGGRCVSCGSMVASATQEEIEAEFAAADEEVRLRVYRRLAMV
jgi:DNA-directed RNA polymerase subunit N (RpoN/RPB10)